MAVLIAANILLPFQERLMGHLRNSPLTHRISAAFVGLIPALMGVGGGVVRAPIPNALRGLAALALLHNCLPPQPGQGRVLAHAT